MLSPRGSEMMDSMGKIMVVASMYPATRINVKPIKCEHTSILYNMLLFKTLRYVFYKCIVILEHYYMYTKRILNSTFFANILVCFKQMQCDNDAIICVFKSFDIIIDSCTALNICLF